MFDRIKIFLTGFLSFLLMFTAGCVTLETQEQVFVTSLPEEDKQGVYHKVKERETLWQIAKTYNVAMKDIIKINNIPKAAKIEKNQLVFIPGADSVREIVLDTDKAQREFVWPIKGEVIKYFHERRGGRVSKGIDIRAQEGDMVRAARTGRVVFADYLSGYGHTVILDHLDGLYSVYARNSKLSVKLNELVLKNMVVGQLGSSNDLAYLHFQIRKKFIEDNPLHYLP